LTAFGKDGGVSDGWDSFEVPAEVAAGSGTLESGLPPLYGLGNGMDGSRLGFGGGFGAPTIGVLGVEGSFLDPGALLPLTRGVGSGTCGSRLGFGGIAAILLSSAGLGNSLTSLDGGMADGALLVGGSLSARGTPLTGGTLLVGFNADWFEGVASVSGLFPPRGLGPFGRHSARLSSKLISGLRRSFSLI
jgi:hypothetical protein